jgi:chemotaxis protein CheC
MQIPEEVIDILQEVVNTGIGKAAVSFSEILDLEINLTFPNLLILDLEELRVFLEKDTDKDDLHVSVRQMIGGGLEGKGIVSFPLKDGKTLVNRLLENSETENQDFGIMERDTIIEVGNVLINAVACSISDMIEVEAKCEMPEIDISNQIVSINEESAKSIYCLGEGKFSVKGIEIQGMLLFILAYEKLEHIISKLSYT